MGEFELPDEPDNVAGNSWDEVDADGDGVPDAIQLPDVDELQYLADVELRGADIDGDGTMDIVVMNVDLDGDGVTDIAALAADLDADGEVDFLAVTDRSTDVWDDITEDTAFHWPEDETALLLEVHEPDYFDGFDDYFEIHGTPQEDMALWDQQNDPNSCAVSTTHMMFRSLGIDLSEEYLADYMETDGTYDYNSGTYVHLLDDSINRLASELELPVTANEFANANLEYIEEMLDRGVRPLVVVDSVELYEEEDSFLGDIVDLPYSCHAVQVIAVEHDSDGSQVVINDPGFWGGSGQRIPADRFMDSADDYGNKGVAVTHV
jgi:hypothetical protein